MLPCRAGAATTGSGRAFGSAPPRPGPEGASVLLWKKMNQAPAARIAMVSNVAAIHSARVRTEDSMRVSGGAPGRCDDESFMGGEKETRGAYWVCFYGQRSRRVVRNYYRLWPAPPQL